ncbi:MAG: DUF1778 domain-containing protein [Endozoicomonas sp.]
MTDPRNRGAQPGNSNAVKGKPATTNLLCRVSPDDKAIWQAAAKAEGSNLTEWVIATLNLAADNSPSL